MPGRFFIIALPFLFLFIPALAQDKYESWDSNYQEVDAGQILKDEYGYADSVNKHMKTKKYYTRIDKYRFHAIYTGKVHPLPKDKTESLSRVLNSYQVNPKVLAGIKNEMLFMIGDYQVWMPVQESVEKRLKKAAKNNQALYLYCLFVNEHTADGKLFNQFIISEFKK